MKNLLSTIALFLVFGFVASNAAEATATFKFDVAYKELSVTLTNLPSGESFFDMGTYTVEDYTTGFFPTANNKAEFTIEGTYGAGVDYTLAATGTGMTITVTEALTGSATLGAADGKAYTSITIEKVLFAALPAVGSDYEITATCTAAYN